MGKNSLHGWKKVFVFTFLQNMKSTGNKSFFLILFLLGLLSMPLLEKFLPVSDGNGALSETSGYAVENSASGEEGDASIQYDGETSPIRQIYFYNESPLPIENLDDFMEKYPYFSEVGTEMGKQDFESWVAVKENKNSNYNMHVTLSLDMNGFFISCAAPAMSHLDKEDLEAFEASFSQYLNLEKLTLAGMPKEAVDALDIPISGTLAQVNEEGVIEEYEDNFTWNAGEYGMSYGILMITILLVAFCAEGIAVSVLTEKSSKVVETLLLSVRPMATIVGKVLASICTLLAQFAGLFAGMAISCLINGYQKTGSISFLPASAMKSFLSTDLFQGASFIHILLAVAIILTGLLLYGVLAGICGASVSRMEEIGEALKLYNILYVIGAYLALAVTMASAGGISILNCIAYLFPLSAPFIAPTHLIIGKMPLWLGFCSFAFLVLMVVLAFLLASRIYANMLFYNGSPMKVKDFVRFAKQSKKEVP